MSIYKKNIVSKLNRGISEFLSKDKIAPHIQPILLHKIYPHFSEVKAAWGTMDEGFTVEDLDRMITWFLSRNYVFITPKTILNTVLDETQNYILLTFDEGYYNNLLALPVLEKHQVPVTVYISTGHIKSGKAFWWDVLFRLRSKEGLAKNIIMTEMESLMSLSYQEQENYLIEKFGVDCLKPAGDLDRPMTEEELANFAKHPMIEIGNHTHYHLNMVNYSKEELINSMNESHQYLKDLCGIEPLSFAYPYGNYNEVVLDSMKSMPYKIAFTTVEGKMENKTWINNNKLLMNRKHFVGWINIEDQCYNIYSGYSFLSSIKKKFVG